MSSIKLKHYAQTSSRRLTQLEWTESALIYIERGSKFVYSGAQSWEIPTGQWLWLPAGARVDIQNLGSEGLYSAKALLFPREILQNHLPKDEESLAEPQTLSQVQIPLWEAWNRIWATPEQSPAEIVLYRGLEILAWLGYHGIKRAPRPYSFRSQIARIYHLDPAKNWQIDEMAQMLALSVDTLQRRLAKEESSFAALLRSLRMEYALDLLQTTHTTIEWIAQSVGYQSRSKFAQRFKERFGLNPHEIRAQKQD